MNSKSNRGNERNYFEQFLRVYPLHGQVKYGDKPDIIVDGERRLGIELTNFYMERGELPESEQKQRKIREDILRKAHRKYMDQGGKYEISFCFNKEQPIHNGQKLISKIVEVIQGIEATRTGKIPKDFLKDIPELYCVYIKPNLYSNPEWRINQVYTHQIMSVPRLTEIVREKEDKAKNYSKCDAYWLLVVVDIFDPSQDQEIRIDGFKLSSDVYEKKFVYKTISDDVQEF